MIDINTKSVFKRIEKIQSNDLPFAMSLAMRDTVTEGSRQAALGASRFLDNPTPRFTRGSTKGDKRRGVFRHRWDNKRAIQRKGLKGAEAAVFVIAPLVDELSNLVFGQRTKRVPEGSKNSTVLTPTRAVLKGLAGKGRLRKLNKYGNIPGLLAGALSKARDEPNEFLNVPMSGPINRKLQRLHPGLYIRVYKDNDVARARGFAQSRGLSSRRVRDKRGRFAQNGGGGRESTLLLLVAYERDRKYKRQFPYEQIVQRSFSITFGPDFNRQFVAAVKDSNKKGFR